MKQSDLKQFKFDNEKRCVGFYCNLNGRDVIFTKDVKDQEKDMFVEISKYIEKHKILDLLKD